MRGEASLKWEYRLSTQVGRLIWWWLQIEGCFFCFFYFFSEMRSKAISRGLGFEERGGVKLSAVGFLTVV